VVAGGGFGAELLRRIEGDVHLASQAVFELAQRRNQIDLLDDAGDHHVYIARCVFLAAGKGAVYECEIDAVGEGF